MQNIKDPKVYGHLYRLTCEQFDLAVSFVTYF